MDIQLLIFVTLVLAAMGIIAAVVLFFVSKAFRVVEDPRIDEVVDILPGANCGGCGFPGCRGLAEAMVKADNLEGLVCPVGSSDMYPKIGAILGAEIVAAEPKIAVLRCNGCPTNAPRKSFYDSAVTCAFANGLFAGESACPNACLGCGDCVNACAFGAITIDPETQLPVIDEEKCVGCNACVKACPRKILELRPKGKNNRRVYVSCSNTEKGGVAKKNCDVACIGCGKCAKVCPFDAITIENNLAYIDPFKCKLCKKCVAECPTGAIRAVNFPIPKPKPTTAPEIAPETKVETQKEDIKPEKTQTNEQKN